MRRAALLAALVAGLAFPAGLGLAVYLAAGSSLAPSPASVRVPTGTIARPSIPPATTSTLDISGNCDEAEHRLDPECQGVPTGTDSTGTTDTLETDATDTTETATSETTETDDSSGRGRGRGRGRGGDD